MTTGIAVSATCERCHQPLEVGHKVKVNGTHLMVVILAHTCNEKKTGAAVVRRGVGKR